MKPISETFDSYHASVITSICVIIAGVDMFYDYTHGVSSLMPAMKVWVAILAEDKYLFRKLFGWSNSK